jgi:hypothetical protein
MERINARDTKREHRARDDHVRHVRPQEDIENPDQEQLDHEGRECCQENRQLYLEKTGHGGTQYSFFSWQDSSNWHGSPECNAHSGVPGTH